MTFKMIEGTANINKLIASISVRTKKLEGDLHIAAVSTLNHAGLHGDITLANNLLGAMGESQRKNALRGWFLAFGKFKWSEEDKALAYDKTKQSMVEEAIITPFWTFKPEAEFKPLDVAGSLLSFINRATSAQAKGQQFTEDEQAAINAVRALVTMDEGSKF